MGMSGACSTESAESSVRCALSLSKNTEGRLMLQVRQASTFTESLGGHTGSEAGTAPGDLEDDHSVVAASEASSAPPAAPGLSMCPTIMKSASCCPALQAVQWLLMNNLASTHAAAWTQSWNIC